jgi:hypothetical protein
VCSNFRDQKRKRKKSYGRVPYIYFPFLFVKNSSDISPIFTGIYATVARIIAGGIGESNVYIILLEDLLSP